jgi:FKBP-type peptidyl-prolyl cis-trans isomerase
MRTAKNGDKVKVHFTGRLDDGTEFVSTKLDSPIEFIMVKASLFPGLKLVLSAWRRMSLNQFILNQKAHLAIGDQK